MKISGTINPKNEQRRGLELRSRLGLLIRRSLVRAQVGEPYKSRGCEFLAAPFSLLGARVSGVCLIFATLAACGGGGTAAPEAAPLAVDPPKLIVLGNSITYAPATPSLDWDHSSGMGASDAAHDFAHMVGAGLGATVTATNVSRQGIEGNGAVDPINAVTGSPAADVIAQNTEAIDARTAVVVQLGDNVQPDYLPTFGVVYGQLLDAIVRKGGRLVCVSTWWRDASKDSVMQSACTIRGGRWVDIGDVYPMRKDDLGRYSNASVEAHPHDWSMAVIAERVSAAMR